MAFAGEMQIPRSARDDRGSQRGVAGGGPPRLYIPASVFLCALRVSAVKTRLYRITGHKTRVTDSFQIPRLMRPDASGTHNACGVRGKAYPRPRAARARSWASRARLRGRPRPEPPGAAPPRPTPG